MKIMRLALLQTHMTSYGKGVLRKDGPADQYTFIDGFEQEGHALVTIIDAVPKVWEPVDLITIIDNVLLESSLYTKRNNEEEKFGRIYRISILNPDVRYMKQGKFIDNITKHYIHGMPFPSGIVRDINLLEEKASPRAELAAQILQETCLDAILDKYSGKDWLGPSVSSTLDLERIFAEEQKPTSG
jgi:hypothetical protein